MQIDYPEIGICGLSCRLCPTYHSASGSRCCGCKSAYRMSAGCPFITCAVKKRGIEFCWLCEKSAACGKWLKHREAGKKHDSFKCYQTLENDIGFIEAHGVDKFVENQKIRERLLTEMLDGFNEGRSKSYYCIAATLLQIEELKKVLAMAKESVNDRKISDVKEKSKLLHSILDNIARESNYLLKLRK